MKRILFFLFFVNSFFLLQRVRIVMNAEQIEKGK